MWKVRMLMLAPRTDMAHGQHKRHGSTHGTQNPVRNQHRCSHQSNGSRIQCGRQRLRNTSHLWPSPMRISTYVASACPCPARRSLIVARGGLGLVGGPCLAVAAERDL